jgi:glucose-like phosphotransferase system IIB component
VLKYLYKIFKVLTQPNDNLGNELDDILLNIGGLDNINHAGACATRLRLTLFNNDLVNKAALKKTGAIEVVFIDNNNIQIIYGMKANSYAQLIEQRMKS